MKRHHLLVQTFIMTALLTCAIILIQCDVDTGSDVKHIPIETGESAFTIDGTVEGLFGTLALQLKIDDDTEPDFTVIEDDGPFQF